jgi:L-aspartate oxidase
MTETIKTDFLVLGSGIAGLTFAINTCKFGEVLIVTKKENTESNTNYAQGGIASVLGEDDTFENHINDTLKTGAGLCHNDTVKLLVESGPARIKELIDLGVRFSRIHQHDGSTPLALGIEGGHSIRRIAHAKDLTGREIERALVAATMARDNIYHLENHIACELLISKNRKRCIGALVYDKINGKLKRILSRCVMLSTGGIGQVYLYTTNPAIATGDGVAMAYRVGAKIANMEFVQFHPTSLYKEREEQETFLISEAVRGEGGKLFTTRGERFMKNFHPDFELAPRDVVARAIDCQLKKFGDPYVYLDISHKPAEVIKDRFPNIYEKFMEFGFDITAEPIPVVPAAHYICGGVVTDIYSKTSIPGLFAAGEVACTGVHGANRLASNSLLEAVVFAHRAVLKVREIEKGKIDNCRDEYLESFSAPKNHKDIALLLRDYEEIKRIMWNYVGIVRSNARLARAERRLNLIIEEIENFYRNETILSPDLIELRNSAQVAKLIVISAIIRKESRGLHYTEDYPFMSEMFAKDTIIGRNYKEI